MTLSGQGAAGLGSPWARRATVLLSAIVGLPAGEALAAGSAQVRIAHKGPLLATPFKAPPPQPARAMRWVSARTTPELLDRPLSFRDGRAVIGLRTEAAAAAIARDYGLTLEWTDRGLRLAQMHGPAAALTRLREQAPADPRIRYVEPVTRVRRERLRNDPLVRLLDPRTGLPYEWAFTAARLDRALNVSQGVPTMLVGIVDSGFATVPDLAGKIAEGWYFNAQTSTAYEDSEGHGTAVAATIAAPIDNGYGLAGFGGTTRLIVFRETSLQAAPLAVAIRHLVDRGVRVINLSFGSPFPNFALFDALNYAISRGVLVVASAGNDSAGAVSYPAANLQPDNGGPSYGLAVGASDRSGARAAFSNWGSRLSQLAPGSFADGAACQLGIVVALPSYATEVDRECWFRFSLADSRYAYVSGTSISAPEVAGAAALIWAAAPNRKNWEIASILKESAARPFGAGWNPVSGWGVLDAARAAELATGRSSADVLTLSGVAITSAEAGGSLTAAARATWQDNAPLESGNASCTATVTDTPLPLATQTVSQGSVGCAWNVPLWAGSRTVAGTITVSDPYTGVSASQSFTAALADVTPPEVDAHPSSGRWRAQIRLRYTLNEETGSATVTGRVFRGRRRIASFSRTVASGTRSFSWRAPRLSRDRFRFCVSARDAGGNISDLSCAPIRLR